MNKRGQVTIFAIIGIVIVVLIVLFLFVRTRVYIGPATQQDLEAELVPIQEHIEETLIEAATPLLDRIGLQGGYISTPENTFRLHEGSRVSYLCWNIQDRPYCRQRVLKLGDMEQELKEFLEEELLIKINVQQFKKAGLDLQQGNLVLDIDIGRDAVTINAELPVTVSKGDAKAELKEFSVVVEVPLGRLYDAMRDVVNAESVVGGFETTLYSAAQTQLTNKLYYMQRIPIYPDKLYISTIKDYPNQEDTYIFQFFIEGEPR